MSLRQLLIVPIMVATLAVGACATPSDLYSADTAEVLQAQVLAVSEDSAAEEFAAALTRLDELVVTLNDALARDKLTEERYASIGSAIELVRADIEAAIVEQKSDDNPPGKKDDNKNPSNKDD